MVEGKSVCRTRFRTKIATALTRTIDAGTGLGLKVVVTLETLFGPVINTIGTVVTLAFSIPVFGFVVFRLATAIHHGISGLFLLPELLLHLCGILPEKQLRLRIIIPRDERGQPICQAAEVLPQLQATIDLFHQRANVRILPIGPFVFPTNGVQRANDDYLEIESSPSTTDLLDCRASRHWVRGRIWFNAKVCRYCFWANWRRMIGYGVPIGVFAVRSIECSFVEGLRCHGLASRGLMDSVFVDFNNDICFMWPTYRLAHELGHACLLQHSSARDNLMYKFSCNDGFIPTLTREEVFRIRVSPHVTYF